MSLSYGLRDHNIIAIIGGPGAGKKTQCLRLCQKLNYTYINTGDLLRTELEKNSPRANEIRSLMANNALVPRDYIESVIMTKLIDSVTAGTKGFILDGYPRDTAQAESFQKKFKPFKSVIFLDVSTPTLTKRLLAKGKASGRNDLTDDLVQRRLRNFREITMPFVESYKKKGICISVNGEASEDVVSSNIEKIIS
uniref:Adenylate kinase active site lid domain-containing protein n=1 Tax=Strongyloides stercoralis TaxID=6248 RepID=A0A0K0E7F6_STRER